MENSANDLFYLKKLAAQYVSLSQITINRLHHAKAIMQVVAIHNSAPVASGVIRWLPEVKSIRHDLNQKTETIAAALVQNKIKQLSALHSKDPLAYALDKGAFSRDLRYLAGVAPLALRNGLRGLAEAEHRAKEAPSYDEQENVVERPA